jgi:guanylate kinase
MELDLNSRGGLITMELLPKSKAIFIFTGPVGSNRKSIAEMVGTTLSLTHIVAYTTRKPRSYETDGQDYHFIDLDTFTKADQNNEFIEEHHLKDIRYGIKTEDIMSAFETHDFVFLLLNKEGSEILKRIYGEHVIRIFIHSEKDKVRDRLLARGDSKEVVENYLIQYDAEISYKDQCEFQFENIELIDTTYEVTKVLDHWLQRQLVELDD